MSDHDPLVKASKKGQAAVIRELVAARDEETRVAYVNGKDKSGSTPLIHTVWPGHLQAMCALLELGADPNIQNNRMNTALHLSCEKGHETLIVILIEKGANADLKNAQGMLCYETIQDPDQRRHIQDFVVARVAEHLRGERSTPCYHE